MNNTEIFLEFWRSYQWPEIVPVVYRLYHDDAGVPIEYSMEHRPNQYIEITPEEFRLADMRARVRDGELTHPPPPASPKLVPSDTGTACHPNDVTVVVSLRQPHQKWSLKRNETN